MEKSNLSKNLWQRLNKKKKAGLIIILIFFSFLLAIGVGAAMIFSPITLTDFDNKNFEINFKEKSLNEKTTTTLKFNLIENDNVSKKVAGIRKAYQATIENIIFDGVIIEGPELTQDMKIKVRPDDTPSKEIYVYLNFLPRLAGGNCLQAGEKVKFEKMIIYSPKTAQKEEIFVLIQ